MLAFAGQTSKAGAAKGGTESTISDVRDNKLQTERIRCVPKMKPLASGKRHSAKVRQVLQQLADGQYDLGKRVNGVLDKLLEVLIT